MQSALPDLDLDGLFTGTWGSNTDNTPPNRFPYADGSQAPAGFLNDFSGFNQGTFRFRLLFGVVPSSTTGWSFDITYRWTGGVLADPTNFLTLSLTGPSGTISQDIPSVGAPSVFTTGTFTWTPAEIASLGALGVTYSVEIVQSGVFVGFWDINKVELFAPDAGADIEITGDGGIEVGDGGFTGSGGIEVGESIPAPLVVSADISGMYTLIPGQHFDRVYTRNVNPDDTADVAIPTPFAKTGYFGA